MDEVKLKGSLFEPSVETSNNEYGQQTSGNEEVVQEEIPVTYNNDELSDPNNIKVTIADKKTPVVVLFGPPRCGKTMILIRLAKYLKGQGYKISPIASFRPAHDKKYEMMCKQFDKMIDQCKAADSTDLLDFMLVEILHQGKRICQILEAPGEHYFKVDSNGIANSQFPMYVNAIINDKMRKIYCVVVSPVSTGNEGNVNANDVLMSDVSIRNYYVSTIHNLARRMRPKDRVIFLFNKIDLTNFVIYPGKVHITQARKEVQDLYEGIFTKFKNENPITSFFNKWKCGFIPFSTGDFMQSSKGPTYQEGAEEYPAKLWREILKYVRG